jgi:uncharacterized membrane protein YccC
VSAIRARERRVEWDLERVRKREEELARSVKTMGSAVNELATSVKAGIWLDDYTRTAINTQIWRLHWNTWVLNKLLNDYGYEEARHAQKLAEKIMDLAIELYKNIRARDRFTDEDEKLVHDIAVSYDLLLSLLGEIPFYYISRRDLYL